MDIKSLFVSYVQLVDNPDIATSPVVKLQRIHEVTNRLYANNVITEAGHRNALDLIGVSSNG